MSDPYLPAESPTTYMTHRAGSGTAASSPNHESDAPKTPFCQYRIPHREETAVMEGGVSGSFDIPRPLRQNSIRKLPPGAHDCGCGCGLDQRFFSRRALGREWHQRIVPDPDDPVISLLPFHGLMIDKRSWLLDVVLRAGKRMGSCQSPAHDDALLASYILERTPLISRSTRTPAAASSPCGVRSMVFQINNQFTISRTTACHLQPTAPGGWASPCSVVGRSRWRDEVIRDDDCSRLIDTVH
jgi:hypothetical protein